MLRHTVERQKSIENTETIILRQLQQQHDFISGQACKSSNGISGTTIDNAGVGNDLMIEAHFRKKPPARLKPLTSHSRQGSVIRVIDQSSEGIPSVLMSGASLIQNVAFANDCEQFQDKSV